MKALFLAAAPFFQFVFSNIVPQNRPQPTAKALYDLHAAPMLPEPWENLTMREKTLTSRSRISIGCLPDERRLIVEALRNISQWAGAAKRATSPVTLDYFSWLMRSRLLSQSRYLPPREMARAHRRYANIQAEVDGGERRRVTIHCNEDPRELCDGLTTIYNDEVSAIYLCPEWFELYGDDWSYPGYTRWQVLFRHLSECASTYQGHRLPIGGRGPLAPAREGVQYFVDRPTQLERFVKGRCLNVADRSRG